MCLGPCLEHLLGALLDRQLASKHPAAFHKAFSASNRVRVSQAGVFPPVSTDLLGGSASCVYILVSLPPTFPPFPQSFLAKQAGPNNVGLAADKPTSLSRGPGGRHCISLMITNQHHTATQGCIYWTLGKAC